MHKFYLVRAKNPEVVESFMINYSTNFEIKASFFVLSTELNPGKSTKEKDAVFFVLK